MQSFELYRTPNGNIMETIEMALQPIKVLQAVRRYH